MLRVAICDEDAVFRERLFREINALADCEIRQYESGKALPENGHGFDLIFLEVEEEKRGEIAVAKRLRESGVRVVIVSSVTEFAFAAYEAEAFQYLCKPIGEERLARLLDRVSEKQAACERETFLVRANGCHYTIEKGDILYVENMARKVILHMKHGEIAYYAKMREVEEALGTSFYRCHRGFLVNLDAVKGYEAGNIFLKNGECILMAKQKYNEFAEVYAMYLRRVKNLRNRKRGNEYENRKQSKYGNYERQAETAVEDAVADKKKHEKSVVRGI